MTYVNRTRDPGRRATAIVTVGAVHALLAVGLIKGLDVDFPQLIEQPFEATNIPLEKPTPAPTETPPPSDPITYIPPPPRPPMQLPTTAKPPPVESDKTDLVAIETTRFPPGPAPAITSDSPAPPGFTPKRPAPRNGNWISDDDYPRRAIVDGAEGSVRYRLVIGTDGRVSACELTRSSGHRVLDDASCRLITSRARFDPATDSTGAKVLGTYAGSVSWQLPD